MCSVLPEEMRMWHHQILFPLKIEKVLEIPEKAMLLNDGKKTMEMKRAESVGKRQGVFTQKETRPRASQEMTVRMTR